MGCESTTSLCPNPVTLPLTQQSQSFVQGIDSITTTKNTLTWALFLDFRKDENHREYSYLCRQCNLLPKCLQLCVHISQIVKLLEFNFVFFSVYWLFPHNVFLLPCGVYSSSLSSPNLKTFSACPTNCSSLCLLFTTPSQGSLFPFVPCHFFIS